MFLSPGLIFLFMHSRCSFVPPLLDQLKMGYYPQNKIVYTSWDQIFSSLWGCCHFWVLQ